MYLDNALCNATQGLLQSRPFLAFSMWCSFNTLDAAPAKCFTLKGRLPACGRACGHAWEGSRDGFSCGDVPAANGAGLDPSNMCRRRRCAAGPSNYTIGRTDYASYIIR